MYFLKIILNTFEVLKNNLKLQKCLLSMLFFKEAVLNNYAFNNCWLKMHILESINKQVFFFLWKHLYCFLSPLVDLLSWRTFLSLYPHLARLQSSVDLSSYEAIASGLKVLVLHEMKYTLFLFMFSHVLGFTLKWFLFRVELHLNIVIFNVLIIRTENEFKTSAYMTNQPTPNNNWTSIITIVRRKGSSDASTP